MRVEEGLVVDGEKHDIVDSFCYPRDTPSTDGGADAAEGVRCAWKKLMELAPFLMPKAPSLRSASAGIRSCWLYGWKTWAMRAELESKRERTKMNIIRSIDGYVVYL